MRTSPTAARGLILFAALVLVGCDFLPTEPEGVRTTEHLLTQPLTPAEFIQPRATSTEVYALIVQDLQDASAALPKRSQYAPGDLGRATKGAAQGMLAEAYLYLKDYPHALAYADSVIAS